MTGGTGRAAAAPAWHPEQDATPGGGDVGEDGSAAALDAITSSAAVAVPHTQNQKHPPSERGACSFTSDAPEILVGERDPADALAGGGEDRI